MRRLLFALALLMMAGCGGLVCGGAKQGDATNVGGWRFLFECSWSRNQSYSGHGRGSVSTPAEGCQGGWMLRAQPDIGDGGYGSGEKFGTGLELGDVSCISAKLQCSEEKGTIVSAADPGVHRIVAVIGPAPPMGLYLPAGGMPFEWPGPLSGSPAQVLASLPPYDDAIEQMLTGKVKLDWKMLSGLDEEHQKRHRPSLEAARKKCHDTDENCAWLDGILDPPPTE